MFGQSSQLMVRNDWFSSGPLEEGLPRDG